MGKVREQDMKNPAGPGTYFSDPNKSKVDTIDLREPYQREYFFKNSRYCWEFLRRNKNYQADFVKYSQLGKKVPQEFASTMDFFFKKYAILLPVDPKYSFKTIFPLIPKNKIFYPFLGFFNKSLPDYSFGSSLMPVRGHRLTEKDVTIQRKKRKFEYEDSMGNKLQDVSLAGVDTTDITIRINLASPTREIEKAFKRTVSLWKAWRKENWLESENRNHFEEYDNYLKVYDFVIVEKKSLAEAARKIIKRDSAYGRKIAQNYIKRAQELIDGGYRKIA